MLFVWRLKDMIERSLFAIHAALFPYILSIHPQIRLYHFVVMNRVWLIIFWMRKKSAQSWSCAAQVYCWIDPNDGLFSRCAYDWLGGSNETTAHRLTASSLNCSSRHQKITKTIQITSRNKVIVERKRAYEIRMWSNYGMTLAPGDTCNNYSGELVNELHGCLFKIIQ